MLVICLLTACGQGASPSGSASPQASASASQGPPSVRLHGVVVEPRQRETAGIGVAFDATQAADLVVTVPAEIDFATDALVCVFLGERPTAGWGLDLQTASLVAGELHLLAREIRPRGSVDQVITYPAGCGLLNRAALPAGELAVRADDTISDEFIVSGSVTVPDPESAP